MDGSAKEEGRGNGERRGSGPVTKQSSLEMDQEKKNLKQFHKSFHVCEFEISTSSNVATAFCFNVASSAALK